MENKFKLGLDVHGVIDQDPVLFSTLSKRLLAEGHEVYILTGHELGDSITSELSEYGVEYTQLFSITSYHKEIGTPVSYIDNEETQPLISTSKWDSTKAVYANRVGLNIHIDDSPIYGKYFDDDIQYIRYSPAVRSFIKFLINCSGISGGNCL